MKKYLIAAVLFAALASPAAAYTGFLLPQSFWPDSSEVPVQAAYANTFFTPQIALGGDFRIVGPAPNAGVLNGSDVGANATSLTIDAVQGGTYRVSTGELLGQVTQVYSTDGQTWRPLTAGQAAPAGAQSSTLQTVTVAEVYFTRGAPTRTAVDQNIGRLGIHPITDPNQITTASGLQVELLFDGQPFPNMPIVIYANGDPDTKLDHYVVTGADGRATLTFDQPGQYVIAVRHRAPAPAGAAAALQSYTTTLTFEVMAQAHATSEIQSAAPANQQQHRSPPPIRRRAGRP